MSGLEGAACRGKWWMFDSTDIRDHWAAREICAECPVLLACDSLLRKVLAETKTLRPAGGGPAGTWAGQLVGGKLPPGAPRERRGRAKPREHGTERGWQQHRHNGEPKCEPCRLAHNDHVRKPKERVA